MSDDLTRRGTLRATGAVLAAGALAGCSDDGGGDSTPTPEFGIEEFVFTDGQPNGYDSFDRQPDATYEAGDVIWVYLDVVGFEVEDVGDGDVRIDLHEDLLVTAPSGDTALDDEYDLESTFAADDRERYFVTNNISFTTDAPSGEYDVEVTLEDEIGGESITRTETFTVE